MGIPTWVMEILACPADRADLVPFPAGPDPVELRCSSCGRRYRIEGDIPVLLIDEAKIGDSRDRGGAAGVPTPPPTPAP